MTAPDPTAGEGCGHRGYPYCDGKRPCACPCHDAPDPTAGEDHWTCGGCGHEGNGPDNVEWYEHTKVCPDLRPASPPAVAASTGTSEDVEALVELLGEHEGCVANAGQNNTGSGSTGVDVWSCGIRVPFVDDLDVMERAHTAAAIASLLDAHRRQIAEAVTQAVTEHADHMETYTLPALAPGFIDGWGHALRLLRRDAGVIADRARRIAREAGTR